MSRTIFDKRKGADHHEDDRPLQMRATLTRLLVLCELSTGF